MCGIAGIYAPHRAGDSRVRDIVLAMTQSIRHRGPDHGDVWTSLEKGVCLGYRRLAILDLSADGNQPMHSEDGRYTIVFNGEIYNFIELREQLESSGARFRGHSDTEVLLSAIATWGFERALESTAGMYAVAVWDARERRVLLARDRAGKKPLYFANGPTGFHFASEIKAIRDGAGLSVTVDGEAIHHYLSLGFIPAPRTAYREIREVRAGTWMEINAKLDFSARTYWTISPPNDVPMSASQASEDFERIFTLAVGQRLRSDVPVGVFLSGGIDSGLITAFAAPQTSKPLRTYTVTFSESDFDEGPLAAAVAERYGTEHQTIHLAPTVETLLFRVAAAYDEPFADPSALPTFAIAEAAARELKVVLNGEGSDELFAGYRRHLAVWHAERFGWAGRTAGRALAQFDRILPDAAGFRTPYALVRRAIRGFGLSPMERYLVWTADGFSEPEKQAMRRAESEPLPSTATALAADMAPRLGHGGVADFMTIDFALSLTDGLLVKLDIATMAHSLEARSPFLDHRLIDWASRLPRALMFEGGTTKPLLRQVAARHLPTSVVNAPKRGFEIPLVDWVSGRLLPMIREVCLSKDGIVCDLFERSAIERLIERRNEERLDNERWAKRLWLLLMLGLWDDASRGTVTRRGFDTLGSIAS
jgi:asparagine synthase (glutamine-hydrolysing)